MAEKNDDYDLLPHRELHDLKKQVDEMKGGPSSRKLMETMEELRNTVNDLIELFKVTSHELRVQEKDDTDIHKKLDRISSQQRLLAEAVLSLSEKVTGEKADASDDDEPEEPQQRQPYSPYQPPMPPFQPQPQMPQPAEPFTPRPFSLQQDMQRQQQAPPFSLQSPPPSPFAPQQAQPDFGGSFGSPYPSPPPFSGMDPQGTQLQSPPPAEDLAGLDDYLGDGGAKKKKGILGMFKK